MKDASELSGHLIVCGLGHVGYRIQCLLARLGEIAVVITLQTTDEVRSAADLEFPLIIGDARDERLLRQAGVERAKGILVVTNDDLANVSIALDAGRLNPEIAIVIRLFDQELAVHLERAVKIRRALSTSALAAPGFLAAALGAMVRGSFEINGIPCLLEEQGEGPGTAFAGRTIQSWAAKSARAVLALQRDDAVTLMPEGAVALQAGDIVTSLRLAPNAAPPGENRTGLSAMQTLGIAVREWWAESPTAIRGALVAFLAIVLISVGVFHFALDLRMVDAFYFVITTVTTVGYGDLSLANASTGLKLYGSFLMLCGATIMATLFSIITDLVLRTRFRDVLARSCSKFKGHVIVAGLDNLGFRLVKELVRNGETVVAIDRNDHGEFLKATRELAPVVLGNARTEETLRKAGIAGAKAVIAVTDDDLDNLSIGLVAKRTHALSRVVLRVFDSTLAEKMQRSLGVDEVLSVSAVAAPTFVGAALCAGVHQGFLLRDGLVVIFSKTIHPGSDWIGSPATARGKSGFPLFVKGGGSGAYQPATASTVIEAGDEIIGARWLPFKNQSST